MKWSNHRLVTASSVFACTGHLLPTICATAGSIFPDAIEGNNYASLSWQMHHRRKSHFLPAYIIASALIWHFLLAHQAIPVIPLLSLPHFTPQGFLHLLPTIGFWFLIGGSLHILEDAVCGRVPIFSTRCRIGIRLFSVGSEKEYIFAYTFTAFLIVARYLVADHRGIPFFLGI